MTATLNRWSPGQPKLTGVQWDANFGTLEQRIIDVVLTSGGLADIVNSPDGSSVIMTMADGRTFTLTVAAPIWGEPEIRVAGTAYQVRDVYYDPVEGSTYYVKSNHVAAVSVAADVAAGTVVCIARAGRDRETPRGAYNPASAYPAASVVSKVNGSTVTIYKNLVDVAAGGPQPGTLPWYVIGYVELPDTAVRVTTENKLLSVVIAELRAEIADLKSRVTALE